LESFKYGLNMGRDEGPQIIQLFGRGVRLKGKNYSLNLWFKCRLHKCVPYHNRKRRSELY